MAISFIKLFQPALIANSIGPIYQLPVSPSTTLLRNGRVRLTNTTGSAVSVTLYAVPSGGTAGAANEFFPAMSVGPNSYVDVDVPQMSAGDTISAVAGTGSAVAISAIDGILQS